MWCSVERFIRINRRSLSCGPPTNSLYSDADTTGDLRGLRQEELPLHSFLVLPRVVPYITNKYSGYIGVGSMKKNRGINRRLLLIGITDLGLFYPGNCVTETEFAALPSTGRKQCLLSSEITLPSVSKKIAPKMKAYGRDRTTRTLIFRTLSSGRRTMGNTVDPRSPYMGRWYRKG